ncbi:MAG: VOC family protein [Pseudomonadota bacterium]
MKSAGPVPIDRATVPAPSGFAIGHVHLRVGDLDRSVAFYRDVIGLDVLARLPSGAAFLGADGYHHHIGLNTWESVGAGPPPQGHTGLYHVAFLYPDRAALGAAIRRVKAAGYGLTGAADHGVSEAVYVNDPDGNGIELYRDRPRREWPLHADGTLSMSNKPLDVASLEQEGAD